MAKKDEITGKGPLFGNLRSHALNSSRRKFNVNIQKITVTNSKGKPVTLKISAKTIKTLKRKGLISAI